MYEFIHRLQDIFYPNSFLCSSSDEPQKKKNGAPLPVACAPPPSSSSLRVNRQTSLCSCSKYKRPLASSTVDRVVLRVVLRSRVLRAVYTSKYLFKKDVFFFSTFLLFSFWTSRGHRCRPFFPPVLAFNFYRA